MFREARVIVDRVLGPHRKDESANEGCLEAKGSIECSVIVDFLLSYRDDALIRRLVQSDLVRSIHFAFSSWCDFLANIHSYTHTLIIHKYFAVQSEG